MAKLDAVLAQLPVGLRRIVWFLILWLMGVTVVTGVAFAIRSMIL